MFTVYRTENYCRYTQQSPWQPRQTIATADHNIIASVAQFWQSKVVLKRLSQVKNDNWFFFFSSSRGGMGFFVGNLNLLCGNIKINHHLRLDPTFPLRFET